MLRIPLILSVWSLAALPAVADAQVVRETLSQPALAHTTTPSGSSSAPEPATDTSSPACEPTAPEPEDPVFLWRLRASRHLDCVISLVERAMTGVSDRGGTTAPDADAVQLSRKDLERIKTLAFWARDAAARIGR